MPRKRLWKSFKPVSIDRQKITRSLFLILLILFFYGISQLFTIKKINCRTQEGQCSSEVITFLDSLKGSNAIFLNRTKIQKKLQELFPLDSFSAQFSSINTLDISISGWQKSVDLLVYKISVPPIISLDQNSLASQSAWVAPVDDLKNFLNDISSTPSKLFSKGKLVTSSGGEKTKIHVIASGDLPDDYLASVFQRITQARRYLSDPEIFVFGDRLFLRQSGAPDIIINVMSDEANTEFALQSIDYLITIKKDAKVIDLEFKHPIIK